VAHALVSDIEKFTLSPVLSGQPIASLCVQLRNPFGVGVVVDVGGFDGSSYLRWGWLSDTV